MYLSGLKCLFSVPEVFRQLFSIFKFKVTKLVDAVVEVLKNQINDEVQLDLKNFELVVLGITTKTDFLLFVLFEILIKNYIFLFTVVALLGLF